MKRPVAAVLITAIVALMASASTLRADHKKAHRVLPPHQEAFGKTYAELAGAWWNWALNQPSDMLPITDETGEFCHVGQDEDFGQGKDIFFLAGNFGGRTERHCQIPKGKGVFFPLVNALYVTPEEGSLEEIRAFANADVDGTTTLACTIDGVPVGDLFAYRAQSPPGGGPFEVRPGSFTDTDLGVPPRGPEPAVADGYWLLVEFKEEGFHEIEFSAVRGDPENPDFQLSIKYFLTIGKPPRIIAPDDKSSRRLYDLLQVKWWTTAFSIPVVNEGHPLFSGGAFGEFHKVMFLAGAGAGPAIDLTIPAGTALFFPVLNSECSVLEEDPFHGDDEASLRACANGHIDNTSGLFATVDGFPIPNLEDFRVESSLFEFGPLPNGNLFGAPAGTKSASVDAGVYLLLAPLSKGTHKLHFGGTFDQMDFSIDTTYNITVEDGKRKSSKKSKKKSKKSKKK